MRKAIPKSAPVAPSSLPSLLAALKQQLRARGLKYREIAEALSMSEVTVKRYLTGHGLTAQTLERLCELAEFTLFDLVEFSKSDESAMMNKLTPENEDRLARELFLSIVFVLLKRGWTPSEIKNEFDLTEAALVKNLSALDSMGLIELHPFNRVKVKTCGITALNGPLRRIFREVKVGQELADRRCDAESAAWSFHYFKLTKGSLERIKGLMEELQTAVAEISRSDHRSNEEAEWYGVSMTVQAMDIKKYSDDTVTMSSALNGGFFARPASMGGLPRLRSVG